MVTSGQNDILLKYQNVRRKIYEKWCVYYQVQRYELVDYVLADLEISDELYEKIQENIETVFLSIAVKSVRSLKSLHKSIMRTM